jgi:nucleotide-binding universal stress UspA family protein
MYRRILVPVDGSETATRGLQHAIGLARDQHATLRVLNVIDELSLTPFLDGYPEVDMGKLLGGLRDMGRKAIDDGRALAVKADVVPETGLVESRGRPVSEAILEDARSFGADLIVMGTHGRRGLNRLLLGSDAERVLRESPVPVLLVRAMPE